MDCVGDDVSCVAGVTRAGFMVSGVAIVTDKRPNVGCNRSVGVCAGESAWGSRVVTEGEEGC